METEIRYYYPLSQEEGLINLLKGERELHYMGLYRELTEQYNVSRSSNLDSFYDKKIDGRFRVRTSIDSNNNGNGKISWKKREPHYSDSVIHVETEVEVQFSISDLNNLRFLLTKVLPMECVESYERDRSVFVNNEVEIVVDRFPFAVALEIENKGNENQAKTNVRKWIQKLNLKEEDAYRGSWDNKYAELCTQHNIPRYRSVRFDHCNVIWQSYEQFDISDNSNELGREYIW